MVTSSPISAQDAINRVAQSAQSRVENGLHKLEFRAMSTLCRVNFHGAPASVARDFQQDVVKWVGNFEARYSRFIPDSLIGKINAAAGEHWVEIDAETDRLLSFCHELFFFTRGAFDPTALPLIKLWNWKQRPAVIPSDEAIQAARELVGWNKVQRRAGGIFLPQAGMAIDLGGIGKEYAVDRVLMLALQRGIENVLVDFGLDVRVHGQPPEGGVWHVGLEDPRDLKRCWTGLGVTNHAVATSGDGVRAFWHGGRRYGHIIDPRTGYPVWNGSLSVSVIAPFCTLAGALSTTAFILSHKEGIEMMSLYPGVEGCITTETTRHQTRGFHAYTTS